MGLACQPLVSESAIRPSLTISDEFYVTINGKLGINSFNKPVFLYSVGEETGKLSIPIAVALQLNTLFPFLGRVAKVCRLAKNSCNMGQS